MLPRRMTQRFAHTGRCWFSSSQTKYANIPLIDFAPFVSGEGDKAAVVKQIQDAVVSPGPGFMLLKNHGIDAQLMQDVRKEAMEFFNQPTDYKEQFAWTTPEENSGYVAMERETLDSRVFDDNASEVRGDPKQSYDMSLDHLMQSVFKDTCFVDYYHECHKLQHNILRAYALALGLDEQTFRDNHGPEVNTLRVLHYPPTPVQEARMRCGDHTDYGTITILNQDMVGGLEVLNRDTGEFEPVKPVEGTMVINTADLLAQWSNDKLRSSMHRVVAPHTLKEGQTHTPNRLSLVYFVNPLGDTIIENLLPHEEAKYKPVTAREHLLHKLSTTY